MELLPDDLLNPKQVAEFLDFEERIENSVQRDLIRVEHLRMMMAHEVLNTTDLSSIPAELQDVEINLTRRMWSLTLV